MDTGRGTSLTVLLLIFCLNFISSLHAARSKRDVSTKQLNVLKLKVLDVYTLPWLEVNMHSGWSPPQQFTLHDYNSEKKGTMGKANSFPLGTLCQWKAVDLVEKLAQIESTQASDGIMYGESKRPTIFTQSGHLVFQTASNHNISFKSSGGFINMDGMNMKQMTQMVQNNTRDIRDIKSGGPGTIGARLTQVEARLNNLQPTGEVATRLNAADTAISALQTGATSTNTRVTQVESRLDDLQPTGEVLRRFTVVDTEITDLKTRVTNLENGGGNGGLEERVRTLETQVTTLNRLLTTDECASNPCRNGGTCVDQFNSFFCRCPAAWTGATCDTDVNECAIYAGTDLGCQNGATCINEPGTFRCVCPPNWHGIRCNVRQDDCTGASEQDLCGHGTCVNQARTDPTQPKYKCICDDGWTTDGITPACNTDVNECAAPNPPCSHDPPVTCINYPGGFQCGACPTGFTGNGFVCTDINECLVNNGGCSQSPRVECINTRGSRTCGPCPAGYEGDGVTCRYVGICNQNNGGCHPVAICTESPGPDGRVCQCPAGYIGNGVGPNGCIRFAGHPCSPNPCIHGTCEVVDTTNFRCTCFAGYTGSNCQTNIDECASNPCQNGGTCTDGVNGYTCQCTINWTGTNCQTAQETCGGRLSGETGSFKYPREDGDHYPHDVSCAWVITTSASKILMITFTRFKIEAHPNCDFDFLQIHDGPSASSHMIGKYCGETPPNGGNLNSTHNQLYFWFRSDNSISHEGFEVHWESALPVCGGDLRGQDHGSIRSPGYPGNYPHNRDCVWTITVSPGKKILFTFGVIAIEHHENCSYDYLEIRDGLLERDPLLQRYCSSAEPPPLTTSSPYARVTFHTDYSMNDRGFDISYVAIDAATGCGGRFNADSGVVISPNYPNPYPHDATCVWIITVHTTEVVNLVFTNMDIEYHSNCVWDYVEVRDGIDETAPLVGRYCGTSIPPPHMSTTNNLWLQFRSDPSNTGTGFRATWETPCGGVYTEMTGELRSPYYPGQYPNDKTCTYLITLPDGNSVRLTFLTFELEDWASGEGCHDELEVRDGGSQDATLISRLCGSQVPQPVSSTSNQMWLQFRSDHSIQKAGFRAQYEAQGGAGCGGTLTDATGSFNSPGHPNIYPHGVTCTWIIQVMPGHVIRLTFNSFSLEPSTNCVYDHVSVYDNSTNTGTGGLLGRYCGSSPPPVLTSVENIMTVIFVSDDSVAHEGFSASYVALNASTVCGATLQTETGLIESPNYPNDYPHMRECEWMITVSQGNQILLNVTDFSIEQHANCMYDYLEIRDGGFETSPLIGKYCGTTIPSLIQSHSNRMYLKFVTDNSLSARGFQIYYDGTLTGCGGELVAPTGSFVSPNYPLPYGHNAECYWMITTSEGSVITLAFADFEVEFHVNCAYDYVQVLDGGRAGDELGKFCGSQLPTPVTSTTNKMWVKFRTDFSDHGRGFHATYYGVCNTVIKKHSGAIESPNFPDPYPHNRDCTWKVETTLGNTINASFSHFDIEDHSNCVYDFLELRNGQDESAPLIGKYCGVNFLPPPLATTNRYLYVRFKSDHSIAHNGFRMEYITSGCGGQLLGPEGVFTSLNYPNDYPHARECVWTITVDAGQSIAMTIEDFNVEEHPQCDFDVLEVYGGPDTTAPLLVKLCHTQTSPQQLVSTGNQMYVRFVSDESVSGRGFKASYKAQTGGCGGNFSTPTGTITSKNYPSQYPHNTDCTWTITVPAGRSVVLEFVDFDVEGHDTCNYDHVSIYDGPDEQSRELLRACGSSLPNPHIIRSTDNQMFIRMSSDGSVNARGFKANYKTGCGGLVDAESDGEIFSPGWPSTYEKLSNCTWTINTDHTGDRVTLTFTHMDIEERGSCAYDYVEVLDGDNPLAPSIGKYCGTRIPPPITSQGMALVVNFKSDASDERGGFRAVYTKSISSCGADLTSEHGAFNSPGYPNSYPNGVECVWNIRTSPGNRVHLSFRFFNTEQDQYCNHDFVEVRDGGVGGTLLGRFCGTTVPSNLTSGHNLMVKFRSNEAVTGQGFMAEYNTLYGGEVTGETGQIASPLYPGRYPHDVDYAWTITVAIGKYVRVAFVSMDIEGSSTGSCYYDYLRFLDGGQTDSREIGRFCGLETPDPLHSSGNQMRLEFHTDHSSNGHGFLFNWLATSQAIATTLSPGPPTTPVFGCGGSLVSLETEIHFASPGYPDGYVNNLDCVWHIHSRVGSRVWINITDIDLEGHGSCAYDYVAIYDGGDVNLNYRMLGKYCGRTGNPLPLVASSNLMAVRFVTDHSVTRIGFNAAYKEVCGGMLEAPTGALQSPHYPNNYPANSNCTWTIQVAVGRTVAVDFEAFNLQGSSPCSGDYLEFRNGADRGSPVLGRFCGATTPNVAETSSNFLTVIFVSDGSGTSQGFRFIYREVAFACGGQLALSDSVPSGTFNSPNYPSNYPENVDCIWVITAPANERIRLDFEDFDIERHGDCRYDYVELRDGGTANSALIGHFCGSDTPSTQVSTGKVMFVRFRTDDSVVHKGFKAKYKIATCGGTFRGDSGTITSPHYPANYENNQDCEWYIYAPTGHYITLSFQAFTLEYASNCTVADYLEIRDFNSTSQVLAQLCGTALPQPVVTQDSFAHVRFRSNAQNTFGGFKLNFVASVEACGGELTAPSATFTSPNFPGSYPHSRRCTWLIRVQANRRVTLTFNSFDVEHQPSCWFDYVAVYNGVLDSSPQLGRYCGTDHPGTIESSGNTMKVIFHTDGTVSNGGFSATYTSNNPPKCGGSFTSNPVHGVIQSPGFDNGTYYNNEQCVWILNNLNPSSSSIAIRFNTFKLEHHGECNWDFVEIREGNSENGDLVYRFCGNTSMPAPLAAPSPSVWILFSSDYTIVDRGFQLEYTFTDCGGYLTNPNGVITSPNYPSNYEHDASCAWKIIAPEGYQIQVTFTAFNLENHDKCMYDFVEIFNGGLASSPTLGRFCGTTKPADFKSMSHELRVEFHSDHSQDAPGFRMQYSFVSGGCGGTFHAQSGQLHSPRWPQAYEANTECIWEIIVQTGYHVVLTFTPPFDLEIQTPCLNDYVEVEDYRRDGSIQAIGRFCGNSNPAEQKSMSNKMRVKFRSNERIQGNGFGANWTAGCGAVYQESEGRIFSPGYPENYDNNLDCHYSIWSDPHKFVVLTFQEDEFNIEAGYLCAYDYVEVFAGNDTSAPSLGKFCGTTAPQALSSIGSMYLQFSTDYTITDRGWVANFRTSECGGVYTDPSGSFQTPTMPDNYHHNANCTWIITVEANRAVELKFNVFDIEVHANCIYDYVAVYDGNNLGSRLIGKFCGNQPPDTIRTRSNSMLVNFVTDATVNGRGFTAAYETTFGELQGCGGILNGTTGSFGSIDADNNGEYEPNLNCGWVLLVPDTKVVQLRFTSFNLEQHSNCYYDYVEIRDGFFADDPLVGKFCGTNKPSDFTASSSALYVRFVSDPSIERSGFQATFTAVTPGCGGVRTSTTTPQNITSPNYPNSYPHNLRCRWTIDAPELEHVQLTVVDFEIASSTSCQNNYIEFRDTPMGDMGQSLHYCGTTRPPVFVSVGRTIQVNLLTDATSSGKGFSLMYQIASCNRTYTGDHGRLTSPRYPGDYPHNVLCQFSIQAPVGHSLAVFFNAFYIEPHVQCRYDYLKVYNGSSASAPVIDTLCGRTLPNPIFVPGNNVFMEFRTDASVSHPGYDITFVSSPTGCGGNLTYLSGSFTSPGFPGSYPYQASCIWHIDVAVRRRVRVQFSDINIGDSGSPNSCANNYVQLYNGNQAAGTPVGTYCGTDMPADFTATANHATVKFVSDRNNTGTGFRIRYSS